MIRIRNSFFIKFTRTEKASVFDLTKSKHLYSANLVIITEYQLPRAIINTANVLHISPFYSTQIINHLLNSRISSNHDKVEGHSANG